MSAVSKYVMNGEFEIEVMLLAYYKCKSLRISILEHPAVFIMVTCPYLN